MSRLTAFIWTIALLCDGMDLLLVTSFTVGHLSIVNKPQSSLEQLLEDPHQEHVYSCWRHFEHLFYKNNRLNDKHTITSALPNA